MFKRITKSTPTHFHYSSNWYLWMGMFPMEKHWLWSYLSIWWSLILRMEDRAQIIMKTLIEKSTHDWLFFKFTLIFISAIVNLYKCASNVDIIWGMDPGDMGGTPHLRNVLMEFALHEPFFLLKMLVITWSKISLIELLHIMFDLYMINLLERRLYASSGSC